MRSAASFEADEARRNIGEETQHFASSKLSSENRPAIGVAAMHLEPSFRRIESDRYNRHRTTPCSSGILPLGCGDRPSHYLRFTLSLHDVEDLLAEVLDVLVQSKRNKNSALKLMRKLLRKYAVVPERLVRDDLRPTAQRPLI